MGHTYGTFSFNAVDESAPLSHPRPALQKSAERQASLQLPGLATLMHPASGPPGFALDVDSGGHYSELYWWDPPEISRDKRALLPGAETASSRGYGNPLDGSNIIQHEQHNTPHTQRYSGKDMLPSLPQTPLPDDLTDPLFAGAGAYITTHSRSHDTESVSRDLPGHLPQTSKVLSKVL
jgi:hypothetical protein